MLSGGAGGESGQVGGRRGSRRAFVTVSGGGLRTVILLGGCLGRALAVESIWEYGATGVEAPPKASMMPE